MFTANNEHPLFTLTVSDFFELQNAIVKEALTLKEYSNIILVIRQMDDYE